MLFNPLVTYNIETNPTAYYPGLGLIQQVTGLNLASLTNAQDISNQYRELTYLLYMQIPGIELVSATGIFSYSYFWFNVNTWFQYINITSYTYLYNQLFKFLLTTGLDQLAIAAVKKDSFYSNVILSRNNSLIPILPFASIYNQFTVYYTGLPFAMFPSLVAKIASLSSQFSDVIDTYGEAGLQVYALSNQYTPIPIINTAMPGPEYDYIDLNKQWYLPYYSYIYNNDIFTNLGTASYATSTASYSIYMLQINSDTTINILPDGDAIAQYNIKVLDISVNNLVYNYITDNKITTSMLFLLHALSNSGLNVYDIMLFNNFNIIKSDVATILSAAFPSLTFANYFYSTTVQFDDSLACYLVPVMTNSLDSYFYAQDINNMTSFTTNPNPRYILPVMPNPSVETKWKVVMPKYAPLYSDTALYNMVTFTTYLFNPVTSSFRITYEFDVPPLRYFTVTTSATYDYTFSFDDINITGPVIVRINTATYLVFIKTPDNYSFTNITGGFNDYIYYSSTDTNIAGIDTFLLYYDTSIFDATELPITIQYVSNNLVSDPQNNNYTYPVLTFDFAFIHHDEAYYNCPVVYNMQSFHIAANLNQMPDYYNYFFKNALNSFYARDLTCLNSLTSNTNIIASQTGLLLQNINYQESYTLCSSSYMLYCMNSNSALCYNIFEAQNYQLCYNALNTLLAALQSCTDPYSLDNQLIYYSNYSRQFLNTLTLRPYVNEYNYFARDRNVIFTLLPTVANYF